MRFILLYSICNCLLDVHSLFHYILANCVLPNWKRIYIHYVWTIKIIIIDIPLHNIYHYKVKIYATLSKIVCAFEKPKENKERERKSRSMLFNFRNNFHGVRCGAICDVYEFEYSVVLRFMGNLFRKYIDAWIEWVTVCAPGCVTDVLLCATQFIMI